MPSRSPVRLVYKSLALVLVLAAPWCAAEELFSPPLSPGEAKKTFTVRPGFVVELVAAEPLVLDPVAFDFGPDGKLWVVEMADYPLGIDGKGKFGGRVRFLEDTDGDGKLDKSTVFLEGLGYPNGVMPYKKGVLVSCSPDILYCEDTDGDGRADVRQVLYTGFPAANQQHRMNGFWWGLDNWIYVADATGKIKSTKTGAELDVGRRDLRIRPDQGLMEPVTGQSQFGRARDDWDNWFGCGNSEPAYHFALEDAYLRKNPYYAAPDLKVQISVAPGAAPVFPTSKTVARFNDHNKANRFTSACGLSIYRDTWLGEEFLGNTFVSEPVHNLVHREVVSRQGTTFTSRRAAGEESSEFLASSDSWFRPTMTRTGPDGALYVADMYRMVIEHPEWIPKEWQARLDLRAGHDKGRIWRVRPAKGLRPVPRIDQIDLVRLIGVLRDANGPQRDMAQRQLIERGGKEAAEGLKNLATKGTPPTAQVHALYALEGLGALDPNILIEASEKADTDVRRHILRLCEPFLAKGAPAAEWPFGSALEETSPDVRLQMAATLGTWDDPEAGKLLGKMMLATRAERYPDRYLEAAILASSLTHLETVIETALEGRKSPSSAVLESLLTMAVASGRKPALGKLVSAIASRKEGDPRQTTAWRTAALAGLLDTLDRRGSSLAKLSAEADVDLKEALAELNPLFDSARSTAADAKSAIPDRLVALRLLARGPTGPAEDLARLSAFLSPQQPVELQSAAVAALGKLRDPQIPAKLLAGWKGHGPRLRSEILAVLLSRREWLPALLDAGEAKQVLGADLDAAGRSRLVEHKEDAIRTRAVKLLAGPSNADRQKILEQHAGVLKLSGDAARRRAALRQEVRRLPPTARQGARNRPRPGGADRQIPAGHAHRGARPEQSGRVPLCELRGRHGRGADFHGPPGRRGRRQHHAHAGRRKIADDPPRRSGGASGQRQVADARGAGEGSARTGSGRRDRVCPRPWPDPQAVPRGTRLSFVRPEALRGELYLLARQGEIFGATLVFEPKYGNVGYWQSESDTIAWTIDAVEPGEYVVSLDYACPDAQAGQEFYFEVAGQRLGGKVKSTGSWDAYGRVELGRVKLDKGQHRAGMRSAGKLSGPLLDLKSIGMRPVK